MNCKFDQIVDRRHTNALNTDGFRGYIFQDENIHLPYRDEDYIRMWVADMEFETPEMIRRAIQNRLEQKILGYSMVFDPAYYHAFAAWTDRLYGWHCGKEELETSLGVVPALYDLVEMLTQPDESVLILTPSYAYFKHAADRHGRKLVCSDLIRTEDGFRMNLEDLRRKAADPKTTLCIFCNPHNPTGRVWTEGELRAFGEIMEENGLWVISDEIHCDLLRAGKIHTPLAKVFPDNRRIVTCMAPSKTFNMAGMMMSNIIIPDEALRKTWKKQDIGLRNPLSIAAAQAAYECGYDWMMELRAYLDENFRFMDEYLQKNLPRAQYQIPEATYLAWVDIGTYFEDISSISLPLFFAEQAGVLLEGGNMFVQNSDACIRLNLACPRSMLQEGLVRICRALNERQR